MEKQMYPQIPQLPGAPDAPPNYNQAVNSASAPFEEFVPINQSGSIGLHPMQPQQQVQQTVYVQSSPIPPLGPRPCLVVCPSCHQQQMSNVRYETATKTHLFAALICVVGLFCCACIPYCVDTCKNPNHYCANCDAYLGSYNK